LAKTKIICKFAYINDFFKYKHYEIDYYQSKRSRCTGSCQIADASSCGLSAFAAKQAAWRWVAPDAS
jgi:hypothetical protein